MPVTFLSPVDVSSSTLGISCHRLTYSEAKEIFGDALDALKVITDIIELL